MKKYNFLFLILILISVMIFPQISFKKEKILLKKDSNSWIMNQIIQEFESKLSYSYNVFATDSSTSINDELEKYNIKMELTEDSSKNTIRVLATFDSTVLDLSEKIKNNKDWIDIFTIKVLEKISFYRLFNSNDWNVLQLTYWDGIDEYPIISSDGKKLIFISDRYIGNRNIWGYDFTNNKYINIPLNFSSEYFPNITEDGSYVFQSSLYGKWDVLIYNPDTQDITRISDASYNAYTPYYFNGDIYFSAEERNGKSWTEIYKYSIKDDKLERLTSLKNTFKFRPTIYNNHVIFQMIDSKTGQNNIYIIKDGQIQPIVYSKLNEVDPFGTKKYIIYSKLTDGYYRIILFDPKENKETPLTLNISDDAFYPSVYNNIVLFSLYYKNGEPDIFAIRLP